MKPDKLISVILLQYANIAYVVVTFGASIGKIFNPSCSKLLLLLNRHSNVDAEEKSNVIFKCFKAVQLENIYAKLVFFEVLNKGKFNSVNSEQP